MKKISRGGGVYGITTIGKKGQVVIPAEARKVMALKDGDKLIVFGTGHGMVAFMKLSSIKKFTAHLSAKIKAIKKAVAGKTRND